MLSNNVVCGLEWRIESIQWRCIQYTRILHTACIVHWLIGRHQFSIALNRLHSSSYQNYNIFSALQCGMCRCPVFSIRTFPQNQFCISSPYRRVRLAPFLRLYRHINNARLCWEKFENELKVEGVRVRENGIGRLTTERMHFVYVWAGAATRRTHTQSFNHARNDNEDTKDAMQTMENISKNVFKNVQSEYYLFV